jgi:glycosyltransferase involved in cell wall biosynthesis
VDISFEWLVQKTEASMDSTRRIGLSTLPVPIAEEKAAAAPPIRILYVEQNVDGTTGGSYRSLLYLVKGLDKGAYAPTVAFYRDHELMDEYRTLGGRTMLLSYPQPIDLVSLTQPLGAAGRLLAPLARILQRALNFFWISSFLFVRGVVLLLRGRVQVLHLNNGVGVGNELLLASKLLGIRAVIHQRGIVPVTPWAARLARQADHVICVSSAARDNLIAYGLSPDRCTAIHNGINMEELLGKIKRTPWKVRESLGIADDKVIVGLAGMIRPWKGQMVLVKAMAQLHDRYPQLLAVIMGGVSDKEPADTIYLNQIRQYIDEHHLKSCITILDYQANAPEFLQIFDVMVHTAVEPEPFSRVIIEGMALGRPIVASANGGTPEAIEDGVSGFLVPGGDADALADRIARLVDDPALRKTIGRAARERVERLFLIQSHVSRTQDVYRRIVGTR